MSAPIYFVVHRLAGQEYPALHYDPKPEAIGGKHAHGIVYSLRLDNREDGEKLRQTPLPELFEMFKRLRERGKLPVSVP